MSRLKNFVHGVFSGYVQMAVNIVFTLASVPLALHYLSTELFALWALVTQLVGYFALIDLGMASSVARILADYKDDRDGGRYGGVLKAGAIVFTAQGALIALATLLLAGPLATVFRIGPDLRPDFVFLLRGHGLIMAFGFATKIFGAPIWGFQRYDITNYAATVGFALQLAALWLGFSAGWGVKSMLAAYAVTSVSTGFWPLVAGVYLGFYPRRGAWGRIEGSVLGELFRFGRDLFLMAIGSQLLSASQIMIISRLLGLDAAATWAICSKIFTLAQQVVGKLFETSVSGFAEMFIRGERDNLVRRFRDVVTLTASAAVVVGAGCAAMNATFVQTWTHGRVSWSFTNDVLLGILLFVTCVSRCHTGMSGVTKNLRVMRFIYFLEGLTFVVLAWFAVPQVGIVAIPLASLFSIMLWSWSYGGYFSKETWKLSRIEQCGWLAPAARLSFLLTVLWVVLCHLTKTLSPLPRLMTLGSLGGLLSMAFLWQVGLTKSAKVEFLNRANKIRSSSPMLGGT